jgi:hypothetical protein
MQLTHSLKVACFQPLNRKCGLIVSNFAIKSNLYRYTEAEALAEAQREYEYITSYVKRNEVTGFEAEAALCGEMAELLPIKIDNLRRLEAQDASAVDPLQA